MLGLSSPLKYGWLRSVLTTSFSTIHCVFLQKISLSSSVIDSLKGNDPRFLDEFPQYFVIEDQCIVFTLLSLYSDTRCICHFAAALFLQKSNYKGNNGGEMATSRAGQWIPIQRKTQP